MERVTKCAINNSTLQTGYGSTTFKISIDGNILSGLSTATTTTTTTTITETCTTTNIRTSPGGYEPLSTTSSTTSSNSRESVCSITDIHNLYTKTKSEFASSRLLTMQVDVKSHAAYTSNKEFLPRLEFLLNIINHICIGFITIYMSWLCLHNHLKSTALHAWLVTLGFNFLMAEALMCYYNRNILTCNFHRNTKTILHWILQLIGGSLGIAGVLFKCIQKGFLLYTVHGKLGFAAFILCCFSLCSGLTALFSLKLRERLSPLLNKTFHNLLGLTTFLIALLAQYYGYETGFFVRKSTQDFQILMKWITLLTLVLSGVGPLKALYYKCCNLLKNYGLTK